MRDILLSKRDNGIILEWSEQLQNLYKETFDDFKLVDLVEKHKKFCKVFNKRKVTSYTLQEDTRIELIAFLHKIKQYNMTQYILKCTK